MRLFTQEDLTNILNTNNAAIFELVKSGDIPYKIINELSLTYRPSGQTVLFRGLDDVDSLTSITVPVGHLCWCWCEEFFQIHDENDFNKLDLSIRGELPDPLYKQITGTLNAWNSLTWIKPRFFDTPDPDVFTLTTTYLQNEFLGIDDLKIFEKMRLNSPARYLVEGLGEWGVCQGLIYRDYADNPEKNHKELNKGEKLQFISVGLDYGSGSPDSTLGKTVLSAVGITQGYKKAYCLSESYFDDFYVPDRIVKWVKEFLLALKENYKVMIYLNCEWASSQAINNALRMALQDIQGIVIEDAYKGTILDRIDLVQILLGQERLFFTEAVSGVKKGFSTAVWDQEQGKLKGTPIRLDNGSTDIDILDATEYALIKYADYLMFS